MKENNKNVSKKDIVYNNTLSILGGLILVWCIFLFIPMQSYLNLMINLFKNSSMTMIVSLYYITIGILNVICFFIGYFGIKKCLLGTFKKNTEVLKEQAQTN
ncbi:MAG: hypothetical protein RSB67_02550 [Clostridia bacterium]